MSTATVATSTASISPLGLVWLVVLVANFEFSDRGLFVPKTSSASWKVGRGFHEGKCLFYCQFDYLIWHHQLILPSNSSLCKLFFGWLFIPSYPELRWDFRIKFCYDRQNNLLWALLLLHSLQLTLQLASLLLWSLKNAMPELLLTSEKLQDTTINKIGRDGPTLFPPWLGFVRLVPVQWRCENETFYWIQFQYLVLDNKFIDCSITP